MGEHQRARLANGTSGGSSWRMTAEAGIEAQVEPDARIERDWRMGVTAADLKGSHRGQRGQRFTLEEGRMLINSSSSPRSSSSAR